jgi:hypothetical protein
MNQDLYAHMNNKRKRKKKETALTSHTAGEELFHLFLQLQAFIHHHSAPYFVGHLHAHTNLPGPLTQGNAIADAATQQVFVLQQT